MRKGDWMQTASGIQFWPMDPDAEEVRLRDIAKALSNLCRFCGHMPKGFYSVAQHSVLVSLHIEEEARESGCDSEWIRNYAATGLMHDATEAYLSDVVRPIKHHLIGYADIEYQLAYVIGEKYSLSLTRLPGIVKKHDERALITEKRDLLGPSPAPWGFANAAPAEPWPGRFAVAGDSLTGVGNPWFLWTPHEAERAFLEAAERLGIRDQA